MEWGLKYNSLLSANKWSKMLKCTFKKRVIFFFLIKKIKITKEVKKLAQILEKSKQLKNETGQIYWFLPISNQKPTPLNANHTWPFSCLSHQFHHLDPPILFPSHQSQPSDLFLLSISQIILTLSSYLHSLPLCRYWPTLLSLLFTIHAK